MPKKVGDHSSISQLSQVGYYLLIFIGPTHMQKMIIYTKIYAKVYQGGRNLGSYIIILPTIVLPLSPYTHSQAKYTPPPWFPSFLGGSEGKASAYNAGDLGSILGLGRSPGEGNGNPLQYSCLENQEWTEEPGRLQSVGSQRVGHN